MPRRRGALLAATRVMSEEAICKQRDAVADAGAGASAPGQRIAGLPASANSWAATSPRVDHVLAYGYGMRHVSR
jgi:hypothetical protein